LAGGWRGLLGRAFGRAGRASPRGEAAARRALLCVLDRDLDGAEAHLQRLARDDSRQVDVYLALARLFRLRGEVGRAIRVHQNLLLRSDLGAEERGLALRGLAEDFRQGGFLGRASETYEQVLARQPDEPSTLRALSELQREAGQPERALELARRLHRVTGAEEGARAEAALGVEVAEQARAAGRTQDARRAVRRALRRDPACAAAHALLGELEVERGRSKRALAAWRRALELDRRRGAELLGKLRSAFAALGRSADYEPFLRQLMEADPDDPAARLELARVLRERGEPEPAAAALRELLERAPGHLEAQAELGRSLAAAGRAEEASAAFAALVGQLERAGALAARERGVE
jgi:lipopolysaccharide biosynthesis regulator YciM